MQKKSTVLFWSYQASLYNAPASMLFVLLPADIAIPYIYIFLQFKSAHEIGLFRFFSLTGLTIYCMGSLS